MNGLGSLGRALIVLGAGVVLVGILLVIVDRFPALRVGRLPGDIRIQRGNFTFYFPLATSILLSVILTLVLWVFGRR